MRCRISLSRGRCVLQANTGAPAVIGLVTLLSLFVACGGPASGARVVSEAGLRSDQPLLTEITDSVGLKLAERPWTQGSYSLPEIMQGGVALLDYDNDGDLDLLHVRVPPPGDPQAAAPNRLYEQRADGTFADVTQRAGIGDPGFGQGVVVGDADNDGDPDVYVTNYGPDAMFRNNGDGTFTDVTEEAGFLGNRWSTAGAFCDYDQDGYLDLVVVHYVKYDSDMTCMDGSGRREYCGPQVFHGEPDRLYRNNGDFTFTDVTVEAEMVLPEGGARARGLGVVCADLTRDGRPDVYVANDGESNQLWVNNGGGTFRDEGVIRGVAVSGHGKAEASMGVSVADLNADGFLDLYITHLVHEHNRLYVGSSGKLFFDHTIESGIGELDVPWTGFGCALSDFDHDGDVDIAVINGAVRRGRGSPDADVAEFWKPYAEPNFLLDNDGKGRFEDLSPKSGHFGSTAEVSRGLALGDLDADGDMDLVISNADNTLRAYRNDAPPPEHHWLMVRALTRGRDDLGATVTVRLGNRLLVGAVLSSDGYLSSRDPCVHFGLGRSTNVEEIVVRWTDGRIESFGTDGVDRALIVRQGTGATS